MSGKTLSNGTLSLRFMQNAQRAKHEAQVEAAQAKVKDDAEWEVSKAVRDAWGAPASSSSPPSAHTTAAVVHESSYVPFLFEPADLGSSAAGSPREAHPIHRGRRKFNARGEEVIEQEKTQEKLEDEGESTPPRAAGKRPATISGFRAAPATASQDAKKPRKKTAQMLVRESAVQPPPPLLDGGDPLAGATGFVRPAGVDAPPARKRGREKELGTSPGADAGIPKRKKKADGA